MGQEASKYLDKIIFGNVENDLLEEINTEKFDCIILADIIEHLKDPWKLINQCHRILSKHGLLIASIPNVRHISTIYSLVFRGNWPYRTRGIHDRTHLRFFTLKNIFQLFETSNFKIKKISTNYRLVEKPHKINKYSKIASILPFKNFFAFQYITLCKKI